ncbi:MAG TPA: DUF2288 family protein [Polyangiaceae bacterium]|nr:DUF2288 family protein [Polyangiaceae bacterium]
MADRAMKLSEAIEAKLEQSAGLVVYSDLAAHLGRDAVFVVARSLSLVACGVAVATDDVERVEGWVQSGELRKPSRAERAAWPNDAGRRWLAVVVQPFVLVQDPAAAT